MENMKKTQYETFGSNYRTLIKCDHTIDGALN